jgi:hypothetical protein
LRTPRHAPDDEAIKGGARRVLAGLLLFGAAFGFVEAAVVVDLRAVYEPLHRSLHPEAEPDDLFPVLLPEQLQSAGPLYSRLLVIELAREAATLAMLAGVALAAGRNGRSAFAAFAFSFGVWDLAFYAALKVLIDWPRSLLTWDLLFLLPVPWVGPVLAPAIVATTLVAVGGIVLWREESGRPAGTTGAVRMLVAVGGLVLVLAFCWDFRNILAGGRPNPFPWPLFAVGEGLGLVGAWLGLTGGRRGPHRSPPEM